MNVSGVTYPIDGPRRGAIATAKRSVTRTLGSRWLSPAWAPMVRDRVAFVTLHRFAEPDRGFFGHDREQFRRALERLRAEGYALLSVDEAVRRLSERQGFPKRSVVFTMDDGYRGALEQCSDIFTAYDCPLTVFVTTGFIDGTHWFWWDQIEYVCLTSGRPRLDVPWDGAIVRLDLGNRRTTITTLLEISEWCKTLADDVKWGFIRALAEAAEVDLPGRAPEAYAPLAWSEIRALERQGFSFGPHTVTHPILPRTTDAAAEWEIAQSWQRVRTEVQRPVGVFSFPNGAYGTREIEILERLGLDAAVTTRGAYASSGAPDAAGRKRFELPRFGYPEALDPMLLIASGFRRIELALAGLRTPGTGVLSRFSR